MSSSLNAGRDSGPGSNGGRTAGARIGAQLADAGKSVQPTQAMHPAQSTKAAQAAHAALARHAGREGSLLPILHDIQHALGHIPPEAVPVLAEGLNLSRADIHGIISFYPHFRQTPPPPVVLEVCRAESCQACGGEQLADHARERLGCDFNETAPGGEVALQAVYCLGLCAQSPAVMINGRPHARVTPEKLDSLLQAQGASI